MAVSARDAYLLGLTRYLSNPVVVAERNRLDGEMRWTRRGHRRQPLVVGVATAEYHRNKPATPSISEATRADTGEEAMNEGGRVGRFLVIFVVRAFESDSGRTDFLK